MSPRSEMGISASSSPGLARRMPHGRELSIKNGTLSLAIYQIQDSLRRSINKLESFRNKTEKHNQDQANQNQSLQSK